MWYPCQLFAGSVHETALALASATGCERACRNRPSRVFHAPDGCCGYDCTLMALLEGLYRCAMAWQCRTFFARLSFLEDGDTCMHPSVVSYNCQAFLVCATPREGGQRFGVIPVVFLFRKAWLAQIRQHKISHRRIEAPGLLICVHVLCHSKPPEP